MAADEQRNQTGDTEFPDPPDSLRRRLAGLRLPAIVLAIVLVALMSFSGVPWYAATVAFVAVMAAVGYAARPQPGQRRLRARAKTGQIAWPDTGMRVIADGLPDPCIIADGRGIVRFINREATLRFGAVHPGDPLSFRLRVPVLLSALERVIQGGATETVEWSEKIPTERWLVAHLAPIDHPPDPHGPKRRPDFVLLVIDDQTETHRTERMRADFVANASHELRTPLASLTGFIETLQGPARNDTVAREKFLGIMREQAARMKRLIDDLLSLSRIEMKAHMRPEGVVDLAEILRHVVEALTPLARANAVALAWTPAPAAMPIRGDRDELVQVFSNLIENAIKYGASGQRVEIEATEEARAAAEPNGAPVWVVSVRDFGPGIDPVHLPRLTERFYRADIATSREKQGTGLGLAIVKHILTRHRARLAITSEPGHGALFSVRFDGVAAGGVKL